MPKENEGSETTDEEVITTPEQAAALDDDESEEKDTPTTHSSSVEIQPTDESDDDDDSSDDADSEDEESSDEQGQDEDESASVDESGEKSQDLSAIGNDDDGLKPVKGETPTERALRLELKRVRANLRAERGAKLLRGVAPTKQEVQDDLSEEEKSILESFDPEQVANQEKLFAILAKKNGYVRKTELSQNQYKETAQSVLDEWLEKHPQYNEDRDPDGVLWKRFGEEFSMYKQPANPKDHIKIFNRIHNDIFGITVKDKAEKDLKNVAAKQKKLQDASSGAGGSMPANKTNQRGSQGSPHKELSQVARSGGLKGYTEEELAELGL